MINLPEIQRVLPFITFKMLTCIHVSYLYLFVIICQYQYKMNNNNLEQLLNINKFLSTIPSPDIHSVQAYVSSINTSDIFSIAFNTPHETLPPLANIDNTAEKILHLQYPHLTSATVFSNGDCLLNSISLIFNANQRLALQFRLAMVVELMKFSDFYLSQKFFEEDYYFSDTALNSAKNSDMPTTYNKEREYIGEIAHMSKPHRFCLIVGLYGLASVIQRPTMSIYPPTVSQLISSLYNKLIKPRIKAYDDPIMIMWTPSSGKWNINDPLPQTDHFVPVFKRNSPFSLDPNVDIEIHDDQSSEDENIPSDIIELEKYSNIVKFNLNVDDNDGELSSSLSSSSSFSSSSSSSHATNNKKDIKKRNSQKRMTKLDCIKNKRLQNHLKVSKIITRNQVQCKCEKIIKLHRAYNPKNLEQHSKTSNCLLTKGTRPLTNYFINSAKSKQISCIRLRDKEHLKYLQRIGGIIHYGGASRVEVLAKELFPKKFDKNFSWKRLTNNKKIKLENELVARAKWRNDFNSNCIRSVKCEIITTNREKICKKCMKLNSDRILRVIITIINK
ncbi:hypothetical protein C1645_404492 [Glomus cerebriforme]|uniref:OTU domain-containing protein n=1 Tax=Glomus cerebriforme TaxID=658196 RepID=A0A397SEU2_9GLOM|nr:hypothetical protein C1645_404492 [Glomus cerebriforme]